MNVTIPKPPLESSGMAKPGPWEEVARGDGVFFLAAAAWGEVKGGEEEAHNPNPEVSREKLCCCCCASDCSKIDVLGDFRKGWPYISRSREDEANIFVAAAGGEDG